MDAADQIRQPGMADRPPRQRPCGPCVEPRPRYPQSMVGPPRPHTLSLPLGDQAVAVLGGPPPPPRQPPCAESSVLPPDRGSWPGPRRARRSAALSCRASAHGRPGPDAATGLGNPPVTPQRREQSGPTRLDPGRGGEIQVDTVSAPADLLRLPSSSRLPTWESAKPKLP
jgi:hypothetical protein